jgi:hypothetical protein
MSTPRYDTELGLYAEEDDRAKRQAEKDKQFALDLKSTFETQSGRRVFWWFLQRTHYLSPVSRGNSSIYRVAAERDLGLELIAELAAADPKLLAEIMTRGLMETHAEREANHD